MGAMPAHCGMNRPVHDRSVERNRKCCGDGTCIEGVPQAALDLLVTGLTGASLLSSGSSRHPSIEELTLGGAGGLLLLTADGAGAQFSPPRGGLPGNASGRMPLPLRI